MHEIQQSPADTIEITKNHLTPSRLIVLGAMTLGTMTLGGEVKSTKAGAYAVEAPGLISESSPPVLTPLPARISSKPKSSKRSKVFESVALPRITKVHKSDFAGDVVPATNEPSGLAIGNFHFGNTVRIAMFSQSGKYALALSRKGLCGWIERATIRKPRITSGAEKCQAQFGALKKWERQIKGLNYCKSDEGKKRMCVDGTPETKLKQSCDRKLYNDYKPKKYAFNNMNYPSGEYGFASYVGRMSKHVSPSDIHYRYTTPDGKAAKVRVETKIRDENGQVKTIAGWYSIRKKQCIKGYPQGGPAKTKDTVPGANPNQSR